MEEIIIEKNFDRILVCVLEEGKIVEKYLFNEKEASTIGNIYMGTIEEIIDGMQACFVDIGLSKKAFLPLKDAMPKIDIVNTNYTDNLNENKISDILKKGQKVLVQIRKEAINEKGARISTHITLAGKYLVLMPETEIITVSQKIEDKEVIQKILDKVKEILPKNFGCIIRTEAVEVSDDVIEKDLKELLEKWNKIQNKFLDQNSKEIDESNNRIIYNDNDIILKLVRDMVKTTTKKIYINNNKIYEILRANIQEELIEFSEKEDFIKKFGLLTELERIDNRKIWLKSGAQIVIDKTEALTAIDVNSSKFVGNKNLEETVFKVNKEAAVEIMKQIRLKDIGGIIIIDFVDMKNQKYKEEILDLMRKEQKKDRSKIEIKDFTKLNLVEMTRKKMYVR